MSSRCVLQITNITHTASDRDLADLFSVAGKVARTTIIQTGFPYYAFVEYFNPDDARRALNLNGRFFGPSKINVSLSNQSFPQGALLGQNPVLLGPDGRRSGEYSRSQPLNSGYNNSYSSSLDRHDRSRDGYERRSPDGRIGSSWDTAGRNKRDSRGDTRDYDSGRLEKSRYDEKPRYDDKPRYDADRSRSYEKMEYEKIDDRRESRTHHSADVKISAPVSNDEMTPIFLTGIPASIKEHNLHQIFSEFGTVCDSKIFRDLSDLPTGRGKIVLHSLEAAAKAATAMDGRKLDNTLMRLSCSLTDDVREVRPVIGGLATGAINDVRPNLGLSGVEKSMHGKMIDKNDLRNTLNSRIHPYSAPIAPPIEPMSTINVHGGASHAFEAAPLAEVNPLPTSVYVGNLPETSCRNCLLYQLFSPYGAIASVKAMEPKQPIGGEKIGGISYVPGSWYGFVNFVEKAGAELAINTLHKSTLDGQILKVVYKTNKWERPFNNITKF